MRCTISVASTCDLHRPDDAIASFEEARPQAPGIRGRSVARRATLKHLGEVQAETGDAAAARASLTGALRIFEQIGDQAAGGGDSRAARVAAEPGTVER